MARKDFVAFYFLSYRIWGREGEETRGDVVFFLFGQMAQEKKTKTKMRIFFFQPPKFHAAQDEAKREDQLFIPERARWMYGDKEVQTKNSTNQLQNERG